MVDSRRPGSGQARLGGSIAVADQLARFAGAAITHRAYELTNAGQQRLDWATHLKRWAPYSLLPVNPRKDAWPRAA